MGIEEFISPPDLPENQGKAVPDKKSGSVFWAIVQPVGLIFVYISRKQKQTTMKQFLLILLLAAMVSGGNVLAISPVGQKPSVNVAGKQAFSISKIYPNPVKDAVNINLQSDSPGNVDISLINILGVVVKKWEPMPSPAGESKLTVDLSGFKSGVYILKVVKSDQEVTQVIKKY